MISKIPQFIERKIAGFYIGKMAYDIALLHYTAFIFIGNSIFRKLKALSNILSPVIKNILPGLWIDQPTDVNHTFPVTDNCPSIRVN